MSDTNKGYKFTGTIISIGDSINVTDKFTKREFVVSDKSARYPQTIQFQATQDRCDLLDQHVVGGLVEVHFNLNGKQWTNAQGEVKTFNSLDAWKINKVQVDGVKPEQETQPQETPPSDSQSDDLPF